ncbi:hypothetical protein ABL78_6635 [Leptomonas seymouri]|uniref:Uncharacterized protein n=1 Tax=Leptomonas seymouri TaxID=5684 RepID=A0A0N1PAX6_LEPSE|nr:hypothetical protein ABL78_6635 [Leptomonas seymouri]|eukprot:KPI84312.1 hypothetical protein ABL78_6635 [Leptomonas seymouri]
MSLFMGMQFEKLIVESNVQRVPKQSSVHSTNSQSFAPSSARASATQAESERKQTGGKPISSSSAPVTPPSLRPQKQERGVSLQPTTNISPRPHTQVKRPIRPVADAPHSKSLRASSSDSDDEFVYMLDSVKTTEEAVERIRAVQQPKGLSLTTLLNGLPNSATTLPEMVETSPNKTPSVLHSMKGGLPASMEEFYEYPRYTVSLTAAREAIFSDALSGFHAYVEREKAQREKLHALHRRHHSQPAPQDPHITRPDASVATHNTVLPSSDATEKGSAASTAGPPSSGKANSAPTSTFTPAAAPTHPGPQLCFPTFTAPEVRAVTANSAGSSSKAASTPTKSPGNAPRAAALVTSAVRDNPADIAKSLGEGKTGPPHLSASYMFIMRSRDSEAMSPVSSPRAKQQEPGFGELSFREERSSGKMTSAIDCSAQPADAQHTDSTDTGAATLKPPPPAAAAAAETTAPPSKLVLPATPTPDPEQVAMQEELQLRTLLQERAYQRARAPEIFRCRYASELAETPEERKERLQMCKRVLRNTERLAGPGGLSPAARQRIRDRYADPNTVAPEWSYVWEQFERDIPRETLFIEDTPHHEAADALAAIMSYVEYCYDRGQQNIQERVEKLLAATNEDGEAQEAKDGASVHDDAGRPGPPPERRSKGFLESLFSASSAAIRGAVATVRSKLPDFVGDPLLSISGLDPALYHASLLFPADPRMRSEKIFAAVREVVLASQQSFMGFPYQLLCEQVGSERLGLALEALAMDEDEDEDDAEEDTLADALAHGSNLQKQPKLASQDVSAPIPIRRADESDAEIKVNTSTASLRSTMPSSRVVRIYQSFSSQAKSENDTRRHRAHTPHIIDEWNVSSSSSTSHASGVVCSPFSPEAPSSASADRDDRANSDHRDANGTVLAEEEATRAGNNTQLNAAQSPLLQSLVTDHSVPGTADVVPATAERASKKQPSALHADKLAQRRRERRRRRRRQLPLLVGEPHPHEFGMFLEVVRARVAAKVAKDERKAREQQRCEQVQHVVERQCEQRHGVQGPRATTRCTSPPSLDGIAKAKTIFREDVEGSAYLLPTQPVAARAAAAQMPMPSLPTSLDQQVIPPEARGMRICLLFNEQRNTPVVVVNKLFRLFTVPGVRGLTSSSEEEAGGETAALSTRTIAANNGPKDAQGKARQRADSRESLLLLIQIQFSLFTTEEAEVRWKWWRV